MRALDHFPNPDADYDPERFMRKFLLMDAALCAVECDIEYANQHANAIKKAIAIKEGKQMITQMLQFVALTYYSSGGRVKHSPVFSEYKLSFPYKPPELWEIVEGKSAPRHEAAEEPDEEIQSIGRAITLRLDQSDV